MNTNQTIDGVPREAFKWALEQLEEDGNKGCGYFDSLRALLDAPVCHVCGDTGSVKLSCAPWTEKCTDCKESAQPQGKPVAWVECSPAWLKAGGDCATEPRLCIGRDGISHLHPDREQPAPVAVVLPDRFNQVMQYVLGSGDLDGYYFKDSHPSGRKYWWRNELRACIDELTRLNTKTICCGLCPGGCVQDLKA